MRWRHQLEDVLKAAADGIHWAFAPMMDIARDPRWGRIAESLGEDPYLAGVLSVAMVRGFQGDALDAPDSIAACAKHYVGDGGTTGGKDQGNTECDEATLRKIHMPGYIAAIKAGSLW